MAPKREMLASAAEIDDTDLSLDAVLTALDGFAQAEFKNDADSKRAAFSAIRHIVRTTGPNVCSKARFNADGTRDDTNGKLDFGKLASDRRAKLSATVIGVGQVNNVASMFNTAIAGAEKNKNLLPTLDKVFAMPEPQKKIAGGLFYTNKVKSRRLLAAAYRVCQKAKNGERDMEFSPAIIHDAIDKGPTATRADGDKLRALLKTLTLYVNGNDKAVPPVEPIADHDLWVTALGAVEVACADPEATPPKIEKPKKPTKSGKPRAPKVVSNVETLQNMALLSVAQVEAQLAAMKAKARNGK